MTKEQYPAWLCLKTAPELPLKACLEILSVYPDPEGFVGLANHPVYQSGLLKVKTAEHLKAGVLPRNMPQIQQLMRHHEIKCLSYYEYPARLREIFAPPLLLYVRGELEPALKQKSLAVVGTRKPTAYGREMCRKLLAPLCERQVSIISGLAMGIDTVAHTTAVQNGALTLGVLASGLDIIYPAQNLELSRKITSSGALVSEFEPGAKPDRWNFPARNRIISALSDAVFIVEGPISSGALLTAKNAIEQNKDICALPGNINNINAEGPNHLLKHGAALISKAEDLMYVLGIDYEKGEQLEIRALLSEDEQKLCDLLKAEQRPLGFDEILIKTAFPIGRLSTVLTNLELKGLIAKEGGNTFFLI
ncbi:MAG: DNA-processing protein DprA [Candidatus Cloacimonetes bacterium]|nr:DNA-processing protein DprA [Candidatus Cloacimonadota bacterium]MCB5286682.1 DNA-processing protein DprA [Candidatus Cloacimonadota bacterium]MCK9184868.1 DNA-processing protein DprA [Candidatus Cloacimonadota bacterium]MCK9584528.1 DNA-processing protein DprA [Candidatus Cloacimonadota bacterium]MDY0229002.1 DNA-processing protein DprA [Candidatus Cloacimonadaceae bacterium]